MSLKKFFSPDSIAVVGASTNPKKLGYAVLENLVKGGYARKGSVYPINLNAEEILGIPAYPTVLDVPGPIDLGVIVIPYPHVPAALRTCGEKGIQAVIVISAGFREAGKEGLERELELIDIAKEYNIRLIGPNCLGVIDTFTPLNASFSAGTPPSGPMAFMSQSGALGTAVLDIALQKPDWAATISAQSPILKAEIIHAVRQEMAQTRLAPPETKEEPSWLARLLSFLG